MAANRIIVERRPVGYRPIAVSTSVDPEKNIVVVGYGLNAAGNTDIYVLKYNKDGELVITEAVARPEGGKVASIGIKDLHPAIAPVGNVNTAGRVDLGHGAAY